MPEKHYFLLYRIWHWSMALATLGLLATVLLRKTFLSYKTNALILQEKLSALGMELSIDQAKTIAKAIRAPMWEWHYIFGFILGISVVLYIYMVLTKKVIPPLAYLKSDPNKLKHTVHALLLLFIFFMTLTGALLYFREALSFSSDTTLSIKTLHEYAMNGVLLFLVAHLVGVFRHEIATKEPIVSKMIHGS